MTAPKPRLRAVLLAAGFATRLYPLTRTCAKPLLEVGGQPMLTRMLGQLAATDVVTDVTVVVNGRFHADFARWRDTLDTPLDVRLVDDGVTDDSANLGAIRDLDLALRAQADDAPCDGWIVAAGDNLFSFPLAPAVEHFVTHDRAVLLLREVPEPIPPARYNEVTVDATGRVTSFREKPHDPTIPRAAIAVYVLPADLPDLVSRYLAEDRPHDAPGYFMEWFVTQRPVDGLPITGRWFDIGNADDLARARAAFA